MNAYAKFEGGALRQRTTYKFDLPPPPPASAGDLSYIRASGLAQVRLQLAVLSGNRRGALRELDRLVEIDRQLEALASEGKTPDLLPGASLMAQLDEQRQAIASEKLALMAAVEFPRLPQAERPVEEASPAGDEEEIVVLEDTEFSHKLVRGLIWLFALIALGTALAYVLPTLATL